ncbi:MAG: 1-acyl-sn-glycerol-3-phosphate acyltransferase [Clostridia bacterium]|nr:1-acyl-sn-glycerol-3-phosphate acyltransferase [Clostridia bacterium]
MNKKNVKKGVGRARLTVFLLRSIVKIPAVRALKYHDNGEIKIKEQPYLVFANHSDTMDPVYIVKTLKRYVRFVMSDHVMRSGLVGKIYNFLDCPIVFEREKGTDVLFNDIVANIKAGVNVAMYPEGSLTSTGETQFISKRNATLVKECDCTFVTFRTKGGYFKKPRWVKNPRKGPIFTDVVHIYSKEDIRKMTEDEIYQHIIEDLYVNAYDEQRKNPYEYICEDPAESAEIILYGCPKCKSIGKLKTKGDKIFCPCSFEARVDNYGFWHSDDLPFDNIVEWDKFQKELLRNVIEEKKGTAELIFEDDNQLISEVQNADSTLLSENAKLQLFADKILITTEKDIYTIPIEYIQSVKTSAKMNILLVSKEHYFEIKSPVPRSATKYIVATRCLQNKENK